MTAHDKKKRPQQPPPVVMPPSAPALPLPLEHGEKPKKPKKGSRTT